MRPLLLRLGLIFFALSPLAPATATERAALVPVAGDPADFGLPQMAVYPTQTPPQIDGKDVDPAWERAPRGSFVHTITGGRAPVETTFGLTYDDKALYVFVRGVERGQESFAVGPSGQEDPRVHDGDAAEIFLQPGGPGSPYFQLAANPWGGTVSYHWAEPGQGEPWKPQGVMVAGHVDFDYWTLEVSIPFAALGLDTPPPGAEWRGNFARNELPGQRLYGAWSATGDQFQNPPRFGRLVFRGQEEAGATTTATVSGHLLNADGSPAVDIPVRAFGRIERSDSLGAFAFADVFPGKQVLSVVSPAHEPFNGGFTVRSAQLELEPLSLIPIDPYRPRVAAEADQAGRWLASSIEEPPDMDTAPGAASAGLQLLATPGAYSSDAVAYLAGRDIDTPTAAFTAFESALDTIAPARLRVRWTQRLLKRAHYQTSRDNAEYVWRFLWDEAPAQILSGQLRHLVATVYVPEDAAPGLYRGHLELHSHGQRVSRLPVSLEVAPFTLATPEKRVGTFINGFDRFSDLWVERMLRDIRAHGGRSLKWWMGLDIVEKDGELHPDVSEVERRVRLQHRLGFEPPYTVGTQAEQIARRLGIPGDRHAPNPDSLRASAPFRQTYTRFVQAAQTLEKDLGYGPLTLFWSDEIFQGNRLEPWLFTAALTRELTEQSIFITHHSGAPDKIARIDPYTDIRCYHGRKLDDDYPTAAAYDTLAAELSRSGDEAWAYYNVVRTDITSEYTRLVNGYWLWRTPVSVHLPWTYFYGDRDSMQGVREGTAEAPFFAFAAPHPTADTMVSTLDWECFREGYDDLRYITTLEQAIAAAPPGLAAEAARAQHLLDQWWAADPQVPNQASKLTAADYRARRRAMVQHIVALTPK